eukprot:GFKZ01002034.1.p1 GENE.GFKZ01002034.1~~GFKZ01002034.1.p1  ORF type:complete len:123 (+),score=10.09 GFKZ01002034.1:159-527(+)
MQGEVQLANVLPSFAVAVVNQKSGRISTQQRYEGRCQHINMKRKGFLNSTSTASAERNLRKREGWFSVNGMWLKQGEKEMIYWKVALLPVSATPECHLLLRRVAKCQASHGGRAPTQWTPVC